MSLVEIIIFDEISTQAKHNTGASYFRGTNFLKYTSHQKLV